MKNITSCILMIIAMIVATPTPAIAQVFPWWGFDSVLDEIQDRGTLIVGLGLFDPWTACNADGELVGFEIDVAKKLAEDMGVEVEFVRTNWNYVMPALIAEDFDAIVSGMTMLSSRNLRINFTSPYNHSGIYIVANIEQTADLETLGDYNSSDVTFATRRGFSAIPVIKSVFPDAMILQYDTDTEVVEAVVDGVADAAAAYATTRLTWVEDNPDTLHLPFDEPFSPQPAAMAVRKGDLDILNFLNSWITINQVNGWLEERSHYWFDTLEWRDQVATDPETIEACEESFQ